MSERAFKYPTAKEVHADHFHVLEILQARGEMRYLRWIIERSKNRREQVAAVRDGRARSPEHAFYYASEESIVLCSYLVYKHMLREKPTISELIEYCQLSRPTLRQKLQDGQAAGFLDEDYMPNMALVEIFQSRVNDLFELPSLMNLVDTLHNLQVYKSYRPAYYNNGKQRYKPSEIVKDIFNLEKNALPDE